LGKASNSLSGKGGRYYIKKEGKVRTFLGGKVDEEKR